MTPRSERHAFLSFSFDTNAIPPDVWLSVGQAMRLCEQVSTTALPPSSIAALEAQALARGVAATTAIEGNTLSAEEVRQIVATRSAGACLPRRHLEREVINIIDIFEEISAQTVRGEKIAIDVDWLCAVNRRFLDSLPEPYEVRPGRLREHDVVVGTYKPPAWTEVAGLLDRFVHWINRLRLSVSETSTTEERFVNAIIVALLAHIYAVWIHPFANGNGRLARLLELQILVESGVVPRVATCVLSAHYNADTAAYYAALNTGQVEIVAFLRYAVRGLVTELQHLADSIDRELRILIPRPQREGSRYFT